MMDRLLLFVIILVAVLSGCVSRHDNIKDIVREFSGAKILIPDTTFILLGNYTDLQVIRTPYKIVRFIGSNECTTCALNLPRWEKYMNEVNSIGDIQVSNITIIESDNIRDINDYVFISEYKHPIIIDSTGYIQMINKIPDNSEVRTFLLDSVDNVLAIGDPVKNHNIKKLYKAIISKDIQEYKSLKLCNKPSVFLGTLSSGETAEANFRLFNKSDTALIISSISAEQGLMVQASNDTIFPFDDVDIRVKVVIDDVLMKNYHNKVTIEFNNHVDREILTVYGYVN